jgi:hypothetical protein
MASEKLANSDLISDVVIEVESFDQAIALQIEGLESGWSLIRYENEGDRHFVTFR